MTDFDARIQFQDGDKDLRPYQCSVPVAGIHCANKPSSSLDDQLLFGQVFMVKEVKRGWAFGQAMSPDGVTPGYIGYVREKFLCDRVIDSTHRVNVIQTPVFSEPDLKSSISQFLPRLAEVRAVIQDGDYMGIDGGWIHAAHVCDLQSYALNFVSVAESYLGLPYVWGGKSGDGLDCSGLLQIALWAKGQSCPRDADQQEEQLGEHVRLGGGLVRGDLVFWKGHVGIMRDEENLLHANAYHMAVASEPIGDALRRIDETAGPVRSMKRLPQI